MGYITRNLERVVLEATKEYPVVLVTGPRQVGKTTMLQKMMEGTQRNYVTLDDLNERSMAQNDPELFLQIHKPPILIDEVQYAPELFTYIKIHVDKKHNPGDFWLTGSQVFRLMKGVGESLAGRVAVLSLTSLSQGEIDGNRVEPFVPDMDKLAERGKGRTGADTMEIFNRIFKGSMPAIISGLSSNSQIFYSSYLSTYIERDVRQLSDAIDTLKFMHFMTAVAARAGQMLNVAEIARDADINQKQAKEWLAILETLGLIFYLHPYSNNMLKRLVKTPKLYFYDTGLICYMTKWSSPETLESGAMNGAILENYVVSEIAKTYHGNGREPFMYYYRDKDAKEIDIVLEHDGVLNPIEIKKTSNPGTELIRVFSLLDRAGTPRSKGAVICMKPGLSAIDRDNYIVPVWMI
ncbi:MAG: ATP-binding protein [Lachnospiraceae bacterium]|nr:ATP-binding protein [Lachnospiraceae bacterium]